jgi:hypothetical protein
MADIEICQRDVLYCVDAATRGVPWLAGRSTACPGIEEDFPMMTIEILYLTAQIQRWLNRSVARHLAAQAAKFTR